MDEWDGNAQELDSLPSKAAEDDFSVSEDEAGKRLDMFLLGRYEAYTRSWIQNLIRNGSVSVNGKAAAKSGLILKKGDRIHVLIPPLKNPEILPEDIPLDILYEDADILIVNKPKGMVVHPAAGHSSGTLVNALMYHCRDLSGINGVMRPGIVHRIDRDTSGALVVCKNDFAHNAVAAQLKAHSITRKYRAIVYGRLTEDGTITATIGRNPVRRKEMAVNVPGGRNAVTHYHVLETFDKFSYIECRLETGRTHQIRVHMKYINHPVLGDPVYGPAHCPIKGLDGQVLHAMTIGLIHPRTGEYIEATAPLPAYFEELLVKLRGQKTEEKQERTE